MEYDLEKTEKDRIVLASSDRIEQSAVPCCMTWYPPVTKEHFIVTANDQVCTTTYCVSHSLHLFSPLLFLFFFKTFLTCLKNMGLDSV